MKTKLCIILSMLICVSVMKLSAQFRLGAEVGMNTSSLAIISNFHRMGVTGGLSMDYLFKNGVMLQSGLLYSRKGASGLWDEYNYSSDLRQANFKLSYIEIPLMVGYRIPLKKDIYLVPAIGAYFAYGAGGYAEVDIIVSNENGNGRYPNEWNPFEDFQMKWLADTKINAFDRFDSGLRFGLSGEISRFVISFAYDLGLKKVWSGFDTASYKTDTHKMKNRTANFSIGYKFSL